MSFNSKTKAFFRVLYSLKGKNMIKLNGGYFDSQNKEYVITDMYPRRPLINYLWNEGAVCSADQFGNGFAWMSLGTQHRDIEKGDRNFYIKDRDSGECYSANRNYDFLPFDKHQCHVGVGYHKVVSEYKGVLGEITIVMPEGESALLYRIKAKNLSNKQKNLSLYFALHPTPMLSGHNSYGEADYSQSLSGLLYTHDGFRMPNDYTKLFVGSLKEHTAFDVALERFFGIYTGDRAPLGTKEEKLKSEGTTYADNYIAAFQFDVSLKEGESFENTFCIFCARSEEECLKIKSELLTPTRFEEELAKQKAAADNMAEVYTAKTPDGYMDQQVNVWLKRQVSLGKTWGRLYGKGFRDVCQDITAFVSFDPPLARGRILHALKHQYEDGNPIRMFEPNFYYPYNDGGAWIPGAVLAYLNECGDLSILDEEIGYLEGDSYTHAKDNDTPTFDPYTPGKRVDSVLCHVKAAIDYLLSSRGERNLVLWRGGDWNDSMNNVGLHNKGESVWLSIATVKAINEFKEILEIYGTDQKTLDYYEEKKQQLRAAIQAHGKFGDRYIYGINDKGAVIGGEDRMFLNPQSWATLAGIDNKEALCKAMDACEEKLKCDWGYVQCYPAFYEGDFDIGRVSYFKRGLFENGSVYNHGVAFKMVADCMLGRGDKAYETLKLISCDNTKNPNLIVEPYAVTNMYIGPENPYLPGYAPHSWITGTAGWIYRAITEYMLGVMPTFKGLTVKPVMPSGWSGTTVSRKFRGAIYDIKFIESDKDSLVFEGKEVDILPLCCPDSRHEVVCYYRKKEG